MRIAGVWIIPGNYGLDIEVTKLCDTLKISVQYPFLYSEIHVLSRFQICDDLCVIRFFRYSGPRGFE